MKFKNSMYREMIENHPSSILLQDNDGMIVYANKSACDFYGYTANEIIEMNISDINTFTKNEVLFELSEAKRENRNHFIFTHKLKNQSVVKVDVINFPIVISDEELLFSVISRVDEKLQKSDKNIFDMFNNVDDAVCVIKHSEYELDRIVESSIAFNKLIEMDSNVAKTMSVEDILLIDNPFLIYKSEFNAKLHNISKDIFIPVNVVRSKFNYENDSYSILVFKPQCYYSFQKEELTYDELKGFATLGKGHLIKVELYLDVNREEVFQKNLPFVNKVLHEDFGNRNLSYTSIEIDNSVLVYSEEKLSDLYVALSIFLEHFNQYKPNKEDHNCKCRIGISAFDNFTKNQLDSLNEIMGLFDPYEFGVIHTYSNKNNYSRALEIKNGIKKAIKDSEFELYAQGIINLEDNAIEGYEILIRWNHPVHGMIMPDEFIPYAELTGEIVNLDLWVIKESFDYIKKHHNEIRNLIFHINLSTKTIASKLLIEHILKEKDDIDVKRIVFEITEDPTTNQMNFAIDELKELGFLLAIDDFGKGYSSFERIRNIGIQYVKIDKSFISSLTENVDDILILKAIISMCNNLNIKVIAEGIEQIEQLEFLYSRKCYIIQGYIFSKPEAIKNLLGKHDALNKHVHQTVTELLSHEISSKKFYNHGRIIMQDINTRYKLITPNVALAEALGYDFDSFVELTMLDMIPVQFKKTFKKFIDNAKGDLGFRAIMLQLINYDHTYSKVTCAVNKKKEEDVFRLYIEFIDNLEENEMELLGLSNSYLQAFDEAPSGMMIIGENFTVKKWNISCENIFGISMADSKDRNVIKLLSNENQLKDMNALFGQALNQGQAEMVLENMKSSQECIICRWHVNTAFDELEQTHQFICIVNDITEGIKRNRELSRVNKALDQSKSIIVMADTGGNIEYVNEMFTEVSGYPKEEVFGENMSIVSSFEHNEDYYNKLWMTIKSGQVWEGEFHNKRKDGGFYWVDETIYPVNENGSITGFVCIQTDTTKEKELKNLNLNLKNRLFEQDKVASLGLLSSGIMHEINNPLSFIQGNIKYIIEQFEDFENLIKEDIIDLYDAFLDIDKGVTQIKVIAEGLKKYIFKGTVEEKEIVDLIEEIKTVLILAKNEYKYHANVKFKYLEDNKYEIYGYASKLKQVFMNFIINAAHAIESSNKNELGNITIELIKLSSEILIQITDDGCGMTTETIERIYEPLFTTKEEGVGSGLGLSVSRQIIEEDHDGLIICESVINKGTVFKIKLPTS
ncbi:MAG: EAL domain-containing protein [Clostridiales bacterium]|nr:EAL domain-containing protein [Clostridiales bacterium]